MTEDLENRIVRFLERLAHQEDVISILERLNSGNVAHNRAIIYSRLESIQELAQCYLSDYRNHQAKEE